MKYFSPLALAFALALRSGSCGGKRMTLTLRRERMTEGATP
jgi:hypothetical protein